jgi:DnaJ-class molecular chaperone
MNRKNRRNYYRLLHVQSGAPTDVIKSSYRTLMRTLKQHPDLGVDGWNAALINEAYAVLCNAEARKDCDRERATGRIDHPVDMSYQVDSLRR